MPTTLSYTPAWLSRPSPGFDLFSAPTSKPSPSSQNCADTVVGPRRTVARRGTEVFVAQGNQVRWADLTYIKGQWEHGEDQKRRGSRRRSRSVTDDAGDEDDDLYSGAPYRTLKVPVSLPITQLVPSPNGNLIAILTSHTVHVAILPDPSHLGGPDTGPIRLKTHTLGPTSHVLGQSPVMSALWHPLGVLGSCLVTVTAEAVVRVWELNTENRWSFDSPALAIDLKKLADGIDAKEDYGASGMGRNKGFSPDSFEMDVASACFGGTGSEYENGWSPMTLWVAMGDGDVYALCPLLPSRWQPPPSLIPSLSVAVVSQFSYLHSDPQSSTEDLRSCKQRYDWVSDIDNQEPSYHATGSEFDPEVEVYHRPVKVGSVPKLQGPFVLEPTPDDGDLNLEVQITDIHVNGAKLDSDDAMPGDEADSDLGNSPEGGLSMNVVCLVTNHGRIHVCLDVDGVEGRWLPDKRVTDHRSDDEDLPALLTFESIDTMRDDELDDPETSFPTFSPDPYSRHAFFVTHGQGLSYVSLSPWIDPLESELQNSGDAGLDFRLDTFTQGVTTLRERIIDPPRSGSTADPLQPLAAGVVFRDSDLGYFLLTERGSQPYAVSFDLPDLDDDNSPIDDHLSSVHSHHKFSSSASQLALPSSHPPRRPLYQPPQSLWNPSPLSTFLDHTHARHRRTLTEEIKFSQSTLILMTEAHKVLSHHTHQLGVAAAELFRRCERLQEEFKDQIRRADEVAGRIDGVTGDDTEEVKEEGGGGGMALVTRLEGVKRRQQELAERYEQLRRRVGRGGRGGRDLSDKELAWVKEVERLGEGVLGEKQAEGEGEKRAEILERYKTARALSTALITQANDIAIPDADASSPASPSPRASFNPSMSTSMSMSSKGSSAVRPSSASSDIHVPPEIRKVKVQQVMRLLEREEALVSATKKRLERLSASASTA